MLDSILIQQTESALSFENMIICSMASIVFGLVIAICYMIACEKYSKNFVVTLALLPMLVQIVIMLVNGNLGTGVAILGAFSLVRFRSVPGNSKEIATVFFAMAVGLATGTGYIGFAAFAVVIISVLLIVLSKSGFCVKKDNKKNLKIVIPESLDYTDVFTDIFDTFLDSYALNKVKTTNLGSMFELTYDVSFKDEKEEKKFIDEVRTRNGNLMVLVEKHSNAMEEMLL